jgi:hypothetical protein
LGCPVGELGLHRVLRVGIIGEWIVSSLFLSRLFLDLRFCTICCSTNFHPSLFPILDD